MEIQMWREILNPYELAVKELTIKFEHLIKEHHDKGYYSSIERVEGRVKTIFSILEKCQKKGISIDDVTEKIEDIAGIRIICQFVEDIGHVVELLRKRSDIEIKTEKDYVSVPKDSGYRSYHMIVWYTVETMDGPKRIMVEIQIRTMAMNFWATIEHSLQYKYKLHMPEEIQDVQEALTEEAAELSEDDLVEEIEEIEEISEQEVEGIEEDIDIVEEAEEEDVFEDADDEEESDADDIEEPLCVAIDNDKIIGYIFGHYYTAEKKNSYIEIGSKCFTVDELYVLPEYRSQGVGKELFYHIENKVKGSCVYITLNTSTKDYKKILHFYVDELDMDFHSAFLIKSTEA